jgi:hypothetical protein
VSNELVVALPELLLKRRYKSSLVHDKKPVSSKPVSWHGFEPKSSRIRNRSADCFTGSVTVNKQTNMQMRVIHSKSTTSAVVTSEVLQSAWTNFNLHYSSTCWLQAVGAGGGRAVL